MGYKRLICESFSLARILSTVKAGPPPLSLSLSLCVCVCMCLCLFVNCLLYTFRNFPMIAASTLV